MFAANPFSPADCVVTVASRFIGEFIFGLSDETPINGHATKSQKRPKNVVATQSVFKEGLGGVHL